jgi:hypothetical protein
LESRTPKLQNEENDDQDSGGQKYEEIKIFFTQTSPFARRVSG